MANIGNGDRYEPSSPEERARKQARVRGMTDPLGSMGFRDTAQRYRREARARRGVFGGAAASFVIGTALIIAANERGVESAPSTAEAVAPTSQVVSGQSAGQPQSATTASAQQSEIINGTEPATEAPSNGLNGGESDEVLVKSRPSLVTNRDDDDHERYDDDDHDDDDEWHEEEDDEDDDDHEEYVAPGSQVNTAPSTNSGSGNQAEIVINQPQSHTQTSSTRD